MSNHFHILLEVPPMAEGGLSDKALLQRLSGLYSEAFASARDRFGPKRKDGARRMKGEGVAAKGALWSLRDQRKGIA